MKLVQILILAFFTIISFRTFGQDAYKNNSYIKNNITLINSNLKRAKTSELTEEQVTKMEKILAQKEIKWNLITSQKLPKDEMAKEMAKIEKEYAPQVEAILTNDQKLAISRKKDK
jgi:hypothetical protein